MNNIKKLREKCNFTQQEVADRLGVKRPTIAKWENGYSLPRAKKLPQLAKLLHCTIDELLERG